MKPPQTRKQAINAMCRQCIADPGANGTWREQVGACTSTRCPLWQFRPLPANAPDWLKARAAKALPAGFVTPRADDVLAMIRGHIPTVTDTPKTGPRRQQKATPGPVRIPAQGGGTSGAQGGAYERG